MSWLSIIGRIFFYISLPFTTLSRWLLVILSPLLHCGYFVASVIILPLKLLAKLETLYIFLGVAAFVGVLAGSVLYAFSFVLGSVFNLTATPEDKGRTAASVHAAREKKKLERVWQSSVTKNGNSNASMEKYAAWLEKGGKDYRTEDGLFGQTILEEDDDSEDVF